MILSDSKEPDEYLRFKYRCQLPRCYVAFLVQSGNIIISFISNYGKYHLTTSCERMAWFFRPIKDNLQSTQSTYIGHHTNQQALISPTPTVHPGPLLCPGLRHWDQILAQSPVDFCFHEAADMLVSSYGRDRFSNSKFFFNFYCLQINAMSASSCSSSHSPFF